MLDINPEIVFDFIDQAREIHAQEGVVIPEEPSSQDDDWPQQILAAHGTDRTFDAAQALVADLEPAQQATMVALMWLGRGDYDVDNWAEALEAARAAWNTRTGTYLLGTPLVASYLEEGLALLGIDRSGQS